MNISRVLRIPVAGALAVGAVLLACVPTTGNSASAATSATAKKLLWSQEFNNKTKIGVDTRYFTHDLGNGFGWGNAEKEYYTASRSNISTDGKGNLVISALRIPDSSPILNSCDDCQFTSAKVKTAGKLGFVYGRMEARMKAPAGSGMWPAFWMLGKSLDTGDVWPECGEIDIFEGKGSEPNRAYGTIHGPGYYGGDGSQKGSVVDFPAPLSDGFHTYAVEVKPNNITFFFDGVKYYSISASQVAPNKWPFNKEFFLILNLATGGNFEPNIDPTINSAQFTIDYIRYYSVGGYGKLVKH